MNAISNSQQAYVLHYRVYRETSLIVDLFTQLSGRVSVIARGARRPKSSLKGLLQPFTPLLVEWRGRGELPTLSQVDCVRQTQPLSSQRLFCGFYLNEILMRLIHRGDPCERLFENYQETIEQLNDPSCSEQIVLRKFEKKLLTELGYALQLSHDANTRELLLEDQYYYYTPEKEFTLIEANHLTPQQKKNVFLGKNIIAINHDQFETKEVLFDAKRLMRLALKPLLGDKPLKSRELF